MRWAVRCDVRERTHPFVSMSIAMPSGGAIALAFSSEEVLSSAGDVITAIGPWEWRSRLRTADREAVLQRAAAVLGQLATAIGLRARLGEDDACNNDELGSKSGSESLVACLRRSSGVGLSVACR